MIWLFSMFMMISLHRSYSSWDNGLSWLSDVVSMLWHSSHREYRRDPIVTASTTFSGIPPILGEISLESRPGEGEGYRSQLG